MAIEASLRAHDTVGASYPTVELWRGRLAMASDESDTVPSIGGVSRGVGTDSETISSVIRVLVLTDLVDSTRLIETLGDSHAFDLSGRHDRLARDLLARFGGREIDKTDGFLLLFERPADAVRYALGYHQALARLSQAENVDLMARVGIHLGEVYLRRNPSEDVERGAKPLEVEGLAKPAAARVMSLAAGRQTLLTRGVFDLARRAAAAGELADPDLRWLAHGSYVAKGVDESLEIFEVGVKNFAPLVEPADTAKVRRVVAIGDELTLGWRPASGQTIPRRPSWTLAERIGEGGFGEVWLAAHASGEKRVFKFCFEAARLRALKREVTLFRLMKEALGHRDDIARILDWSFDEAPYFLEAEYAESGNLVEWARNHGGLGKVPLETRLELVAQVAEALHAAHSAGILHKDVKPENVLVVPTSAGGPRIQLTDFGVGRLTDKNILEAQGLTAAGFTEMGFTETVPGGSSTSGTRRYMAPELIDGKAPTVQADLYSLGVMLYQMIAGDFSRTLASGWRREVRDELLAEDVALLVDGAPERRPESALVIARKLRGLDERRAQRAADRRADGWRQRRQWLAAGTATVLFVAAIVAVQATLARREADRLRAQSEHLRGEAEELVGFMLGDLQSKLKPMGRLDVLESAGEKVLGYFESLPEEDLSDQALARYAEALNQIGDVQMAQGNLDQAAATFRESLAKAQALAARDPGNTDWLFGLGQSRFWVGNALYIQRDYTAALQEMQEYLEISLALQERQPENVDWLLEVAYGHNNVGGLMEQLADPAALEHFRKALAVSERLAELEPQRRDFQLRWINAHLQVGHWHETRGGDLVAAMPHYQDACGVAERLSSQDPADAVSMRMLALTHDHLGKLYLNTGDLESALQHFQWLLERSTQLIALDGSNVESQNLAAYSREYIGATLDYMGRSRLALENLQTGIKALEGLLGSSANSILKRALRVLFNRLGYVHLSEGEVEKAEFAVRRALELGELEGSREGALAADTHILLGQILAAQGLSEQAAQAWEKALVVIEAHSSNLRDYRMADPWVRAMLNLGRLEEAKPVIFTLLGTGYREARFLELCAAKGWDIEEILGVEMSKGRATQGRIKP